MTPHKLLTLVIVILYSHSITGLQFTIPTFCSDEWGTHDSSIRHLLNPIHFDLSSGDISPNEAADRFSSTLTDYFGEHTEFVKEQKSNSYIAHKPKTLAEARKRKNVLRKKAFSKHATPEDKQLFRQAVRTVSFLNKQGKKKTELKTTAYHEKQYRTDFWGYSKKIVQDTYGKQSPGPTFSKESADIYYPQKYSSKHDLDPAKLTWFPYVHVPDEHHVPYNMSSIKPKDIKAILKQKKATSAPGDDGLLYGLLRNLPSTHHFMATLFTKILLCEPNPPESWSKSKVVLIYKSGTTDKPENFRMISLTSCVSKVFHQVLANRTGAYLTKNGYIKSDVQKAFLKGINGCIEHNIVLQEAIAFSKNRKKTLHVTFFDLADAFGSVSHSLISKSMNDCIIC